MLSREHRPLVLSRLSGLHELQQENLGEIDIWYVAYAPIMTTHLAMMTTLAKRWHSETLSFHLPTGEASVTLEDI